MSGGQAHVGLSLVGYDLPIASLVDVAVRAERAGLDSIWSGEYFRSAFVVPAAVAQATSRIGIGTGIALAFVRTPLVTALSAIDLDELSGGRFVLGLGSQVKTAIERWHGLEYSQPAARMAETVSAIRAAAETHTTEPQRFSGRFYELDWTGYRRLPPPVRPPRIFVGGVKPPMIRVAVAVADGVIGHVFWSSRYRQEVVEPLLAAARPGFEVASTIVCAISEDADAARADAKRTLAFYASTRFYADMLEADGFSDDAERARAAVASREPARLEEAISDEMLETYAIAGRPDEAAAQLAHRARDLDLALLVPAYYLTPSERVLEQYNAAIDVFAGRAAA